MQRDICIDRLRERATNHKDESAYYSKKDGRWVPISWGDYYQQIRSFAKALMSVGVQADDKVAILGFNCLEWVTSAVGTQYVGAVCVGVYTTSSMDEVAYVVSHSDSRVLVVENIACYERQVKPIRDKLEKVETIVLMSNEKSSEDGVIGFNEFLSKGDSVDDNHLEDRQKQIDPESIATMIYTSGTTGHPKSVMLSHHSISWTVRSGVGSWNCGPWDRAISYLPLAHVAEQFFSVYAPIDCGVKSYFATSFEELKGNISEVEPTVFFGVPRVYEKIYDAVKSGLAAKGAITQKIVSHLSRITREYYDAQHHGRAPSLSVKLQYLLAKNKIFSKLRKKIGLSKARLCMSGAAPISKEILDFFCGLDIPIYEIYGQSECSGPATYNLPDGARLGSVGKSIPGGEVCLAKDGEVLIKGPHVFSGYYKNPQATQEVMRDGWLYTGDIGTIDNDGFLKITDRKKDILITAGGKNISPQNLESLLKGLPFVQSAVVVGDAKKYLAALLSPDIDSLARKASDLGVTKDKYLSLIENQEIHKKIRDELDKLNQRLAPVEQIKRYSLLSHEFSIETGEFTPTMKVKRKFVNQKYKTEIEGLYQ